MNYNANLVFSETRKVPLPLVRQQILVQKQVFCHRVRPIPIRRTLASRIRFSFKNYEAVRFQSRNSPKFSRRSSAGVSSSDEAVEEPTNSPDEAVNENENSASVKADEGSDDDEKEESAIKPSESTSFSDSLVSIIESNGFLQFVTFYPLWQHRRVFEKIEKEANENPKDADKQAKLYEELNKTDPVATIERFERREFATNASTVVEYLRALVVTNAIAEYLPDDKTGRTSGLPALLQELNQRSSNEENAALPYPGLTEQLPLHVVIAQSKSRGAGKQGGSIIREIFQTIFFTITLVLGWLILTAWLRKYVSGITGGVGGTPGGMAGATGAYSPKEYSKDILPEKNVKTFADVKGCDEAKAELEELVEYLKNPLKFTRLGGKLPKGVLLIGPPGTGKTLLAKAIAGEAGVPFFYRAGSEFEEMFVGVGARRVRSLFQVAKKKSPCIVFIDEIDAIGGSRKQWEGHTKKTLNQLLVEMDGFEANDGIIVLAATNLPETLDPALTRPGRFDRHVVVSNPDVQGREEILNLYLKDKPLCTDVNVQVLARGTPGFSGADLANLVNEAAVKAAKENKDQIAACHLEYAKDKILMGTERKSMFLTDESKKLTAYHESGHAVVALRTAGSHPIHKATIMPRGEALGMVMQLPEMDQTSRSREQMMATLDVCMGGRVAEEMVFGRNKVTSGAKSDLQTATAMARHMVCECGMSEEVGPLYVDTSSTTLSPSIRKTVDDEVVRLLKEAYERVKTLLKKHERELHRLAGELIERETLSSQDIHELLDPVNAEQPQEELAV